MKTGIRVGVSVLSVAMAIVPWVVAWSALPDPMASHWSFSGAPNGHAPRAVLFALLVVLAALFAFGGAFNSRHASAFNRLGSAGAGMAFAAAVMAVTSLEVVVANHSVATWRDARLPAGWIVVPLLVGAAAAVVTSRTMPNEATTIGPGPTTSVGHTERLAWNGYARGRLAVVVAAVAVVVGVVLMLTASPSAGVVTILAGVVAMAFGSVHVFAGGGGVRVRGPFGVPRVVIPMARIASAEVVDVNPMEWGGWGYRGSLGLFKRAAWVVRRGEGLKLNLNDGRQFLVTVDGAAEAAAVLNGLKDKRA